jgi:hypothetical protein
MKVIFQSVLKQDNMLRKLKRMFGAGVWFEIVLEEKAKSPHRYYRRLISKAEKQCTL